MHIVENTIVEIDRVIFKDVSDAELNVINKIKSEKVKRKFFTRMIISAFVIVFVVAFHSLGMVLDYKSVDYVMEHKIIVWEKFCDNIIWIIALFIIFNAISYFYTFVKRQLVCLTENYYILLEAVANEKYLGAKLALEGKNRKNRYVVFQCDQGVCSKAIQVSKENYRKINVGDKIVVLKAQTVEGFTLNCIKEDEYRNYYDAELKKAQGTK